MSMKGALLAVGMAIVYFLAVTAALRVSTTTHRARLMTLVFVTSLPLFVAIHLGTPTDLGILPLNLLEPRWVVDLGFGMMMYCAAFFGGVLQLYNLADRGLSLRILIDISESPTGGL